MDDGRKEGLKFGQADKQTDTQPTGRTERKKSSTGKL